MNKAVVEDRPKSKSEERTELSHHLHEAESEQP